ncbi:rRNA-processing protein EFG1 [Penicillium lagena]|uniref:rRNA-processing protein EFG1 n=1 Tax=Penicillium lagena TaxID=94218 RepID=UPI00254061B4|nr:rRNA-processing protein EFG1 [Penicillium lagena]KAJ5601967.1 rRNA-processing protein EFG1 [Penicillium lagena]
MFGTKPRDPQKRKSRQLEGGEDVLPARKKLHRKAPSEDEDSESPEPAAKSKSQPAPQENNYPSVNELKKRIRDVKRLLNKPDLPADARVLQQRALAGYEQDLAEETARRQRSQMIKKYHFVRFLDRKTATKELNRLQRREKEPDLNPSQKERLAKKIQTARVNLNYTIYYPLTEKYISLYPKSKDQKSSETPAESDPENEPASKSAKPALWSVVAKCMDEGILDQLRDGKLNINANGEPIETKKEKPKETLPPPKAKQASGRGEQEGGRGHKIQKEEQGRKMRKVPQPPVEEDSDGGFFEE